MKPVVSGALQPVHRYAIVANMSIVALAYATGGLSADLVQIYAVQVLALSPGEVGVALGVLMLSVPLQILAPGLALRFGYRRLMRVGYAAVLVLLLGLAALPGLRSFGHAAVLAGFIVVVFLIEVAVSASWGVAWHPWMQQITDRNQRPRFIARMQLTAQTFNLLISAGFALAAGVTVSAGDYQTLLAVLATFLVVSIALMGRIPDAGVIRADRPVAGGIARLAAPIRSAIATIRRDRRLRLLHAIVLIDTLVMIPLLPTYALLYLGMPAGAVAAAVAVRSMAGVIAGLGWARAVRVRGPLVVIAVSMSCTALLRPALLAIPQAQAGQASARSVAIFVVFTVAGGAVGAGYGNALLSAWYDATPSLQSAAIFTVRDVVFSTKSQLAMAVSGLLLASLASLTSMRGYVDGYKVFILAGVPAAVAVIVLAARVARTDRHDSAVTAGAAL